MDDGNYTTVTIEVDKDLVRRAEAAGIDIRLVASRALRDGILAARDRMSAAEREELLARTRAEIAWRNEQIEEDGLFGEEWRTF